MGLDPLPWFDIIVGLALLVSAGVGFYRGGTREVVTALALVVAAVAAIYGLRWSGPIGRNLIDPDWLGTVSAGLVVFVAIYGLLRITGAGMVRKVRDMQVLGMLDRLIGLGFGLIRAVVVLGAFHLVFHAATPPDRLPKWMTGAAFYPLTRASADTLKAMAPKGFDMADKLRPSFDEAVRDGSKSAGGDSRDAQGYDPGERGGLDDLVEKSR
ncbi:CvpA family protein [Phenylobacterium sp. LH3H17]|uniref:CvpA family protein n=1 Tax=Phenylobacterium sp. LH3H17 TaxID=2903901 RepID=UPI0020CA0959|nr:CvpA family protein [Phenylobacterium sp. LH3H17]UTP37922.1 CvpA family protein [Phenylobacterium sp. LH3H17]